MDGKLEREKTYGEIELLANPNLARIREKKNRLVKIVNKTDPLAFNELALDFVDKSSGKYTRKQLGEYGAFHILISSGVDFSELKTDLPAGDSVEEFLDEQLAKLEIEKEK